MAKQCTDHLGNQFESMKAMCRHWNITQKAYDYRKKRNWTLEQILTTPVQQTKKNVQTILEIHSNQKLRCAGIGIFRFPLMKVESTNIIGH